MRNYVRFTIMLILLAGLIVPMSGMAAQEERVLVVGHAESTDSLDPARAFTPTSSMIHQAVYDTLVTFPPDSVDRIVPELAESWEVSDDGLTYTFYLRQDVVFSTGNPMTADDVVFSFMRAKNITGNPSFLAETIESVEAIDDYTVAIHLSEPDPALLAKLIFGVFSVMDADEVIAHGGVDNEDAAEEDAAEDWLNQNSVGTGPYILESWDPQVETVLVRNPNYWGDPPYFDRIIIRNIPEAATQKISLEAGEIDIALDITADQVPALEENEAIEVFQGTSPAIIFLLCNQDEEIGGPMSNPLVQLAIRYAIDYDGILELAGGAAVQPASVIPVGFFGAFDTDQAFDRDLDRARELLAEAGYPDGFEVDLQYPEFTVRGIDLSTLAQKVQADLAEVGITVNLAPGEILTELENYRNGREGFGLWWWEPDYQDPVDYVEFLPGRTVGLRVNWTDENADPEILELRDRALVEMDDEARLEIFADIQEYLQQNGPWAPLVQPGVQFAYQAGLQGVVFNTQWIIDFALLSY